MSRKLRVMPGAEEATMVTWEELEQAITDGRKVSRMVTETGGGGGGAWAAVLGGAPEPFPFLLLCSIPLCGCLSFISQVFYFGYVCFSPIL